MDASQIVKKLKSYWKVDELLFLAEYHQHDRNPKIGFFNNLSSNDRKVFYPPTEGQEYDRRVSLRIKHDDSLKNGKRYAVRVKPDTTQKSNNPYLVEFESVYEVEGDIDSPREFIKKWFTRKGENPGDAATIAAQLRLNELELYTQTERFIFELLQNADDMPIEGKKVSVNMELTGDYFLFFHDGKFFDRNDVKAIADAAQSTKSRDKTKTGYKGIGFKSVFTDSSRVFIKSFDYSFKFDKLHSIYQNFWELYAGYIDKLSLEAQQEFKRDYRDQEERYTQIERIPWQIKPIWVENDDLPAALRKSQFWAKHNVSIVLEIGSETFVEKQYNQKISNLLNEPRFLLFLRNITSVGYKNGDRSSTLALQREEYQFNILLDANLHSTYTKWEADIIISNESFTQAGFHFQKRSLQEGKYEFISQDGQQIKNIPEKLSILDRTAITFAAQIQNNMIQDIPREEAILFNYLPTSDKRFEFPFLVNGDFITKTDREFILHENLWNQYLFFHIGYLHIKWLNELAKDLRLELSYLNLLVGKLKDKKHQSEGDINAAFNRGINKAVNEIPFIRTQTGEIALSAEVILDETKLSQIIGSRFFYNFTGTYKKLPSFKLPSNVLYRPFLGIERFDIQDLVSQLSKENSRSFFAQTICTLSEVRYQTFLQWLNTLCDDHTVLLSPIIAELPFLRFGDEVVSWSMISTKEDYLLLDGRTDKLREEMAALGLTLSDSSIDLVPALKKALNADRTYLDTDLLLYTKLSGRCGNHSLKPVQKGILLTFFGGLNQVGEEKYARTLCLYTDESGVSRPLEKLIDRKVANIPIWFNSYRINEHELASIPSFAAKHLVQETNVFSRLFCDRDILADCTKSLDSKDSPDWATQLLIWRAKDQVVTSAVWNDLPWLFTNDQHRFKPAAQLWYHSALDKVPAQAVIESMTGWVMPDADSHKIADQFSLKLRSDKLTIGITKIDSALSEADVKLLLQFSVEANETDFLKKWSFLNNKLGGYNLIKLTTGQNVYLTTDDNLAAFIALLPHFVRLPKELSFTALGLGELAGKKLIEELIKKYPSLNLTPFIVKIRDNELGELFLTLLPTLPLQSNQLYERTSNESLLIQLAHRVYSEKDQESDTKNRDKFVEMLRGKAILDGDKPESRFFQEKVVLKVDEKAKPAFNLSELLPHYAGSSLLIDKLEGNFTDFDNADRKFLRTVLFKTTHKKLSEIVNELRSLKEPYLTPLRTVFLLMCHQSDPVQFNDPLLHFKNKVFDDYFNSTGDTEALNESYAEFLTHCLTYQLPFNSFGFYGLDLNELVDAPEAIHAELFPDWLLSWAYGNKERYTFLWEWGVNGPESEVVKLRKSFQVSDLPTANELVTELRNEKQLLQNTMQWLYEQQTPQLMSSWITIIYSILSHITSQADGRRYLPVRLPKKSRDAVYELILYTKQPLHLFHDEWGDKTSEVLQYIKSTGGLLIEADMPKTVRKNLQYVDDDELIIELPEDFEEECELLDDRIYVSWEDKAKYPIYVYHYRVLPWKLWYNGVPFTDANHNKSAHYVDGKTYLTINAANDFPTCLLETEFPATQLKQLLRIQKSFDKETKSDRTEELDTNYNARLDSIKQGQEHSKEEQRKWHAEAVKRCKNYLANYGYDFSECETKLEAFAYEYDSHVKNPSGNFVNVYYRSAKGGLLYLNPGLWTKLGKSRNILVVIYEDGEPKVFTSQESLLEEEYNPYMLYRVQNDKQVTSVNAITEQLEDGTSHLLFVTGPAYYQHLYDVFKPQAGDLPIEDTSTGASKLKEW